MPSRPLKPAQAFLYLRIYLVMSTYVVSLISLASAHSLNANMIAAAGPSALVVTWLLVLLASVALVDIIINDVLSDHWRLPWALAHRHLGYVGMAVLDLSFVFAMARAETLTWLAARYLLDASFCTLVAWGHIIANQPSRAWPAVERRQRSTDAMRQQGRGAAT